MELLRSLGVGGGAVQGAGTAPRGQAEEMSVMEEKGFRWRHEGVGVVGDCSL